MGQCAPTLMRDGLVMHRQWWWVWLIGLVSLLGGALRFAALDAKTLWLDEVFSLWMARHALPDLLAWLVQIDHHPPLYYLLLHGWIGLFGESAGALRSLSALTSTLAIPLYGVGARKLAGMRVGLVAALLLAISPFQVRYAQEARMYGVLMLATAALFVAFAHLLTSRLRTRQWRWWLLLVVAEAAAMLTHNTATVLVPVALNGAMAGLWLAQRHGWHGVAFAGIHQPGFFRRWCVSQVGALGLWSPWAFSFVRQAQVVDGDFWIAAPDLWTVWMALTSLTFAHLPAWVWQRDYLAWLAVGLMLCGLWQWRRRAGLAWVLLTLWLLPPALELLASLRRPIFYDRTLIWTTLPLFMLMAQGMVLPTSVRRGWRRGWLALSLSLVAALCGLGLWGYFADFEKESWDEVAAYVAAQAQPQDLVLFHASWAELPFDYYYPAAAPALTQHGVPADLFDAGVLEPPMTPPDAARVRTLVTGRAQVWLVYSHWWYTDPDGLLPRVLGEQMRMAEAQEWPGIRVVRYER